MSIECNNTTPLGSRAGEELLSTTSEALTSAIVDLASLVPSATDPTASLDRATVVDAKNVINNLLSTIDLDETGHPSLKEALEKPGGLSVSDVAQFAIDTGTDLNELKESILNFANTDSVRLTTDDAPAKVKNPTFGTSAPIGSGGTTSSIDTGSGITTILDNTTSGNVGNVSTIGTGSGTGTGTSTGGATGTGTAGTGTTGTGTGTTSTPTTTDNLLVRTDSTGNINTDFKSRAGSNNPFPTGSTSLLDRQDVQDILIGGKPVLPIVITNLLNSLDFNIAGNYGQKLTSSVCGAYNDVLADLTKAFAVVNTAKTVLTNVENLLEKDVKKLAESIKQRGVLETLVSLLEDVINTTIDNAKKVALAAIGMSLATLKGMASATAAVMKKLNKTIRNINDYMKDASVAKIIEDMKALVAKLASQFERLTPENVANIMFRLCTMAQNLQAILMAPALKLNKMANSMASEAAALKSQNAVNQQEAIKYGAIRVSESERQNKTNAALRKYKSVGPSNRESDYVNPSKPTEEEVSTVNSVSESGLGSNITFSSAVVDSEGWKDVNDNVYVKLLRIVAQTGESYEIKQAFVKREKTSNMGAIAMNSHNSGYAIDIVVTEKNLDDTIVAASRAGFTGIGVYNGHLHLDLGSRRGWLKGSYSASRANEIQSLLSKHSIDGFKKKRS
jgi:hypothetical protein